MFFFCSRSKAATPNSSAEAAAEDRAGRQACALKELAEMGMEIARAVRDQATAPADPETPPRFTGDLVLMFSRAARAVRQTLALEERLAAERRDEAARTAGPREERAHWARHARHSARKRLITEVVGEAIEIGADVEKIEDIQTDWAERLADGELAGDLFSQPVSEIVAEICADLGVTPDWSLWEEADWAREEAVQEIPGSPYAKTADVPFPRSGRGGPSAEEPMVEREGLRLSG